MSLTKDWLFWVGLVLLIEGLLLQNLLGPVLFLALLGGRTWWRRRRVTRQPPDQ